MRARFISCFVQGWRILNVRHQKRLKRHKYRDPPPHTQDTYTSLIIISPGWGVWRRRTRSRNLQSPVYAGSVIICEKTNMQHKDHAKNSSVTFEGRSHVPGGALLSAAENRGMKRRVIQYEMRTTPSMTCQFEYRNRQRNSLQAIHACWDSSSFQKTQHADSIPDAFKTPHGSCI